jgi:2-keto-3-deoxy-L-rhamnonate aldolase RhmA
MPRDRLKKILQSGRVAIGSFMFLRDPAILDIAGRAGLDFVVIDCEHSGKTIESIEDMVRAAEAAGVASVVRVLDVDEGTITQVLETGVQGLMIPCVNSAEMASRAWSATRYPPSGTRGVCRVSRSAGYGRFMNNMDSYMKQADSDIALIGTIENKKAVDNATAILNAGSFDACIVGRGDLSADLGVAGQMSDPKVERAVASVEKAVSDTRCAMGIATYDLDEAKRYIQRGYRCVIFSADVFALYTSMRHAADSLHDTKLVRSPGSDAG